jgi:hypothetical protein
METWQFHVIYKAASLLLVVTLRHCVTHIQSIVEICKQISILMLHHSRCGMIALLKLILAFIHNCIRFCLIKLNLINFTFQIF